MSDPNPKPEYMTRPVGGTESSWCRSVPGGTGIAVIALLLSKPINISLLQNALDRLQISHPALRSKLRFESATNTFSYVTPPTPHVKIQPLDPSSTTQILETSDDHSIELEPHQIILEHELNNNAWQSPDRWLDSEADVFFVSLYDLGDDRRILILRMHTAACDRTSAVALLRELLEETVGGVGGGGAVAEREKGKVIEGSLGIEDLIPPGKANKPFWARGIDVLGYSLNALRLANLNFVDPESPRCSRVVRLQMNRDETEKLVAGCKSRGIKLCSALAAAGLMAAYSSKNLPDIQTEKYAVVTLMDCRSILEPVLKSNHLGFYHSAIMNTHDITGSETLWELSKRCYDSFTNAKNSNKHFTDISDFNFLMSKVIENPDLTPSSSLRTAFISVFEEPVIDEPKGTVKSEIGLEDYVGCASTHGIGPSIALFDTIRNGKLDCACVYPSPLHSRKQMMKLIDDMKKILLDGSTVEG